MTVAESTFFNEARKSCFAVGSNWWNATTGEQLTEEDLPYHGPTFCLHQHAGTQCLSPMPAVVGETPTNLVLADSVLFGLEGVDSFRAPQAYSRNTTASGLSKGRG